VRHYLRYSAGECWYELRRLCNVITKVIEQYE